MGGGSVLNPPRIPAAVAAPLPQLRDLQPVRLRPVLDRFLGPRQRLGDRLDAHALGGEPVELLDLLALPGLAMAGVGLGHQSFAARPPLPLVEGLAAITFLTSFFGFLASLLLFFWPFAMARAPC